MVKTGLRPFSFSIYLRTTVKGIYSLLREKKRVKGKRSTRTAPITPKLAEALREWMGVQPEGPFLFCQSQQVVRSKTKREGPSGRDTRESRLREEIFRFSSIM